MTAPSLRGRILTPDLVFPGEVILEGDRIAQVRADDRVMADSEAASRWICPGFIDLQLNGTHGIDLAASPHRVDEVSAHMVADGVTAYLPTVITAPSDRRERAIEVIGARIRSGSTGGSQGAAVPLGIHLEGPLLSPARRGAHDLVDLGSTTSCRADGWHPGSGVVMVTLAPELPGARELIAELSAAGVVVSLGHTDATAEEFQMGLDAGARTVTHLFNAMRPFGHRDPGPIGVVLADDTVSAGLICDGIHVHPIAARLAWRALGSERLYLVTDAVAARGTGTFPEGVRQADGRLAGSALSLDQALRNLIAWTGAALADAVRTVTSTPARVLGDRERGVIAAGARADLTVLDEQLRVDQVLVGGVPVAGER